MGASCPKGPSGTKGSFRLERTISGPKGPRVCGEAANSILCSPGVQMKTLFLFFVQVRPGPRFSVGSDQGGRIELPSSSLDPATDGRQRPACHSRCSVSCCFMLASTWHLCNWFYEIKRHGLFSISPSAESENIMPCSMLLGPLRLLLPFLCCCSD